MVKRKKEGASASTKIFSGIFFLAGLAVLVYIGVSLGKEAYRKRQVQKEIENLQSEIAKVSQETLAEMIGTTRSRVSFFMNTFRKLGFIEYNGSLAVHSSLLNVVLHDQPQIKI